jgi:glycosyltransferase involved in cell wall biosynthesis
MDRDGVDSSVWRFAEDRHPVLSANGKVNWYQGQDLYGLDLLVDLVARLAEDFPTIGLVICFFDHFERDQSYVDSLVERARELGVERNILFNTARSVLLPVIDASDLFVRPTATDGDANSIREALYVGTPVVASDCVVRPAGVACFRNRDIDDLEATVRRVLGAGHSDNSEMATEVRDGAQIRASTYLDFLTNILD